MKIPFIAIAFLAATFWAVAMTVPSTALAWDCDFYEHCCFEYAAAMQEAGSPPEAIQAVENTCTIDRGLPLSVRHNFCFEAWFAMGEEINSQYERGILGYVPESCPQGPLPDDDEILEPDPAFPDPADDE